MSAQLKIHLTVHVAGGANVEKMTDWETHAKLWIYSNARVGRQRITYFSF